MIYRSVKPALLFHIIKIAANIKLMAVLTAIIVSISNEFKTSVADYLMTPHPILVPALPDGCDL